MAIIKRTQRSAVDDVFEKKCLSSKTYSVGRQGHQHRTIAVSKVPTIRMNP
jgi:hypothetical protein